VAVYGGEPGKMSRVPVKARISFVGMLSEVVDLTLQCSIMIGGAPADVEFVRFASVVKHFCRMLDTESTVLSVFFTWTDVIVCFIPILIHRDFLFSVAFAHATVGS
jgi:hypothetical protein